MEDSYVGESQGIYMGIFCEICMIVAPRTK